MLRPYLLGHTSRNRSENRGLDERCKRADVTRTKRGHLHLPAIIAHHRDQLVRRAEEFLPGSRDFDLRKRQLFVALDDHEVDIAEVLGDDVFQRRFALQVPHHHQLRGRRERDDGSAGVEQTPGILAARVEIERVVRVFDGADAAATARELWDERLDEGGLSAPAATDDGHDRWAARSAGQRLPQPWATSKSERSSSSSGRRSRSRRRGPNGTITPVAPISS